MHVISPGEAVIFFLCSFHGCVFAPEVILNEGNMIEAKVGNESSSAHEQNRSFHLCVRVAAVVEPNLSE